ncbi:Uncharacterised protein g4667 [Pycnogonum litorale]
MSLSVSKLILLLLFSSLVSNHQLKNRKYEKDNSFLKHKIGENLLSNVTLKLVQDEFCLRCTLCQYVIVYFKELIKAPPVQKWIQDRVRIEICSKMIPPIKYIRQTCSSFMDIYGNSSLDIISYEMHPGTICYDLDLCPKRYSIGIKIPEDELAENRCGICKVILDYFDKLMLMDDVEHKIADDIARKVCMMSQRNYLDCMKFLQSYLAYGFQLLAQMITAGQLCEDLELC